jgi:hypothetical protein
MKLQEIWGFTCDCIMCTAESKSTLTQLEQRSSLVKEMEALLPQQPPPSDSPQDKAMFDKAEELAAKLRKTYDAATFEDVPKLALANLGRLMLALRDASPLSTAAVAKLARRVLEDCGYKVPVSGRELHIDRTHCLIHAFVIDAAICAAGAYRALKVEPAATQFFNFAQ